MERLKVVELCDVTGRIRDRLGLHSVALGNNDPIGFITGGAPHRIWLQKRGRERDINVKEKKRSAGTRFSRESG